MRVCEQTAKAAPERELRYSDLELGDVFRWEQSSHFMVKNTEGHTYMTGTFKGQRFTESLGYHSSSYLIAGDYEVVVYPDACLGPGEATTHTTGS